MMSSQAFLFPLDRFALQVDLDLEASVQHSRRLAHHGPDFLFAVAEVWLNVGAERHLLVPKTTPGNFFEDLSDIAKAISNPPRVDQMETIIGRGGWCSWMAGYWARLDQDLLQSDDEATYQKLIQLSMLDSKLGQLAIYTYQDSPTIEAATRSCNPGKIVSAWDCFDPRSSRERIDEMSRAMAGAIRAGGGGQVLQ